MNDETSEEDDEEMMGVPEDLEVAASDDLHGRRDDEDQGQSDDDACDASDRREDEVGGDLLQILKQRGRTKRVLMIFLHIYLTDFPPITTRFTNQNAFC